ncbi:MAG: hypothetical protein AAF850_08445 [Pseudomonadota bacterium]
MLRRFIGTLLALAPLCISMLVAYKRGGILGLRGWLNDAVEAVSTFFFEISIWLASFIPLPDVEITQSESDFFWALVTGSLSLAAIFHVATFRSNRLATFVAFALCAFFNSIQAVLLALEDVPPAPGFAPVVLTFAFIVRAVSVPVILLERGVSRAAGSLFATITIIATFYGLLEAGLIELLF